jgi:uncharacterized protein (DUF2252 family)
MAWDLRRFVASLALVCWLKALPDDVIDDLVDHYVRSYLDQIDHYVDEHDDTEWALTLDNAEGLVLTTCRAKLRTRATILDPGRSSRTTSDASPTTRRSTTRRRARSGARCVRALQQG